jgi:hypothetical protein
MASSAFAHFERNLSDRGMICRTPWAKPGIAAHRLKSMAADSPLDTATLLTAIALIGLIIFLLWM